MVDRGHSENDGMYPEPIDVSDELFAPDYVNHGPFPRDTPDLASLKRFFAATPAAFPDMRVELKDVIAEGDLVAYRAVVTGTHRGEFAGLKPTGRRVEVTEINLSRFRDGLMVEHWALLDEASMMRQLAGDSCRPRGDGRSFEVPSR